MHIESLDLNLLRILDALLREEHVTRAADSLQLSQSATSHALARLRQATGDPLLVRKGNQLVLSQEALRMQPIVAQIMHLVRDELAVPPFDPISSAVTLSIAMPYFLHGMILPILMPRVRQLAPGLQLELVDFRHEARERFARDALDLLIIQEDNVPRGALRHKLGGFPLRGVASADNLRVREPLTVEEYCALAHVLIRKSSSEQLTDSALAPHHLRRRVVMTVPNGDSLGSVIAGTDLVAVWHNQSRDPALAYFDLPVEVPMMNFELVRPEVRRDHQPGLWLAQLLTEVAALTFPDPSDGSPRPN